MPERSNSHQSGSDHDDYSGLLRCAATDELAEYANHQLGQAAKQEHARNAHQMGLLLHIQGCECAGFRFYAGTGGISVTLAMGCRHKSIRVPGGVHEKPDKLSTVVDAVDCGRADPVRIIDRLEESIVEDESVSESCSVRIRSNHVVLIVQAECLGEGGPREIESEERPLGDQKAVVLAGVIDVKTRDRPTVVDASDLGPAPGWRDPEHHKNSPVIVENVGMIDPCGIGVIARSLVKIIQAEELVEGGTWEIYGCESAVDVQEAVSGSSHIDIEPICIEGKCKRRATAPVVDHCHLRSYGIG